MTALLTQPAQKAGSREWIGLAVLALPCLLYAMDLTVLNLALPHLVADLNPTSAQLLWIVDIYGFLVAGTLITMGTLGDRIGRRKLLMCGALAFGGASILAATATTPQMLILARAILGVAAATLAPSTLSLLRNMFHDPRERTMAIGVWITAFSAGGAIGPLVGGIMLHYFWWGSVFLLALPVMVLLLVLGPSLLPEFKDPKARPLDIPSAALALFAVLALIFGLKGIATAGLSTTAILSLVLGAAAGVLFIVRQRRLTDPLIELALFRAPAFSASLAIAVAVFFAAFASWLLAAQYFQLVLNMTALVAGLWSLPSALAFVVGAQIVPRLAHRFRPAHILTAGLMIAATGFLLMAQAEKDWPLVAIVAGMTLSAIGFVPVFTLTTDLIVGTAPSARAGSAAAISETGSELGGALGIAILGSLVASHYRLTMAQTLPGGLPESVAAQASDTLGGAIAVSGALDPQLGDALAAIARAAYGEAFVAAALVSAVLLTGTAVLAFGLLRHLPPIGSETTGHDASDTRDIADTTQMPKL